MSIKSWQLSDNYYELECDSLTIEKLINTKPDPYYTNRDLILVADISAVEKIKFEIFHQESMIQKRSNQIFI